MSANSELELRLKGYRTTTLELYYHMPDHPGLLQSFLWQTLDLAPRFPRVHAFLDHWRREVDAVIHTVRLASSGLVRPVEWRAADLEIKH